VKKVCFILGALICASPAILLRDGLVLWGIVAGVVAFALAISSYALRPGEISHLASAIRPAVLVAALPALWILFQVCPLGVLAHPIWTSTRAALGHAIAGTISVDPGATVIGFGQYLTLGAAAFLSAAVAVDRQRAEWLLFALTGGGVIAGLLAVTYDWLFSDFQLTFVRAQALDSAAMGAIIACAACVRLIERHNTGRLVPTSTPLMRRLAPSGIALAICIAAVCLERKSGMFVATGCGVATLACVLVIRWFGLRLWGTTALAVPAIGIAIVIAANQPAEHGRSLLLAFAEASPISSTAMSQRMLEDAPLLGTGVGTFAALAPIYREMDDRLSGSTASTTAAAFAIELGRPLLWSIATVTLIAIVFLLRASLRRGRDWFYPAMGASCLIALFISAFVNAGLLGTAPGVIGAGAFGLAFAQSKSRTPQP
jgi:hypothetical protein